MIQSLESLSMEAHQEQFRSRPIEEDLAELSRIVETASKLIESVTLKLKRSGAPKLVYSQLTDVEVYAQICAEVGLDPAKVRKACRTKSAVHDRRVVIEMLDRLNWGQSRIGRVINRHPGSISNALKPAK